MARQLTHEEWLEECTMKPGRTKYPTDLPSSMEWCRICFKSSAKCSGHEDPNTIVSESNISTGDELHAQAMGRLAQKHGAALSDCPYDRSTFRQEKMRENWKEGYSEAEEKQARAQGWAGSIIRKAGD